VQTAPGTGVSYESMHHCWKVLCWLLIMLAADGTDSCQVVRHPHTHVPSAGLCMCVWWPMYVLLTALVFDPTVSNPRPCHSVVNHSSHCCWNMIRAWVGAAFLTGGRSVQAGGCPTPWAHCCSGRRVPSCYWQGGRCPLHLQKVWSGSSGVWSLQPVCLQLGVSHQPQPLLT
jgi:hypothetical protein